MKTNGKKLFAALLTALMILGAFAGSAGAASEATVENSAALTIITAWEIPKEVIELFESETGVQVKQDVYTTDCDTIRNARMASGEALDIVGMDQATARGFSGRGYLVDLTDEALWANVKDNAVEDITQFFGGKRYGVSFECSALGVWYNKDIFAEYNLEPPTCFEEFIEVCDTLVANGVTPLVQGGKDVWPLDQHLRLAMNQLTETYPDFQDEIVSGRLHWNDPEVVEVIAERTEHLKNPDYFAGSLLSTTYDQCWQIMLQEKAAMWVMGQWAVEVITKSDVEPTFEIGAFAAPNNAKGTQQVMVGDTYSEIFGVLTTSTNTENAIKFLEFLTRKDVAELYQSVAMNISTIKDVSSDSIPASADWGKVTELPVSGTYTFYDEVNKIMDPLLTNLVIGDLTVEDYCDQLQAAQEIDSANLKN